jgi:hypothetical protein
VEEPSSVLFSEDVGRSLGSFDDLCPAGSFNAGVRGLPPNVDLERELTAVLECLEERVGGPPRLTSADGEQGLQAAAMLRWERVHLVRNTEVSICTPFWPGSPELGTCGAHFVGLNVRHVPWDYYDRPADEWLAEHWLRHRPALYRKAHLAMPS